MNPVIGVKVAKGKSSSLLFYFWKQMVHEKKASEERYYIATWYYLDHLHMQSVLIAESNLV